MSLSAEGEIEALDARLGAPMHRRSSSTSGGVLPKRTNNVLDRIGDTGRRIRQCGVEVEEKVHALILPETASSHSRALTESVQRSRKGAADDHRLAGPMISVDIGLRGRRSPGQM